MIATQSLKVMKENLKLLFCLNHDFCDFRIDMIWIDAAKNDRLLNHDHQFITSITVKTNSPVKL